jgi:multisubunit Na+/H+ antiporter MnhC subunit
LVPLVVVLVAVVVGIATCYLLLVLQMLLALDFVDVFL